MSHEGYDRGSTKERWRDQSQRVKGCSVGQGHRSGFGPVRFSTISRTSAPNSEWVRAQNASDDLSPRIASSEFLPRTNPGLVTSRKSESTPGSDINDLTS